MRTDILGVGFDDLTLEEAVARGTAFLEEDRFHYVVTPNPELVDRASREGAFREALNGADLVLPDGIGVIYAARILGRPLKGTGGFHSPQQCRHAGSECLIFKI